jgi:hypothetical protein
MADDKTNQGQPDRSRVAAEQQYEVSYFADKHGITLEQARYIIRKAGTSRADADAAANGVRAEMQKGPGLRKERRAKLGVVSVG